METENQRAGEETSARNGEKKRYTGKQVTKGEEEEKGTRNKENRNERRR